MLTPSCLYVNASHPTCSGLQLQLLRYSKRQLHGSASSVHSLPHVLLVHQCLNWTDLYAAAHASLLHRLAPCCCLQCLVILPATLENEKERS